ncbi:MAG: nickel pincer cofactor biosynthesis protein LarC [Phycisphaerae bacterium]|jgi:uncharacterized protein (TIGR00299 family) protein
MNVAYFDCFSGAGGDMIVASLIDAGADAQTLREGLSGLGVEGYALSIERINKQGFAATRFHVQLDRDCSQPHRHLKDVVGVLERSTLSASVQRRAVSVFTRLAEAEAKVHGTTVEQVHFHEVGAVDALLDVVGAVLGLELLGVERVVCSAVPTGSGTVVCEHGVIPVPAPATAELLRGVPLASTEETGELLTPTAAAVLTTLAVEFGPLPAMTVRSVGHGAGTRDGKRVANVLRVMVGECADDADTDSISVVEANLDDATPEVTGHCMERLFAAGALDVYAVPIQMKKSRPGVVLTALCEHARAAELEAIIFAETPTFGVRRHSVTRAKMRRRHETVSTRFGEIRMKVGERGGVVTASPEYEDCQSAAKKHGAALRDVMAAANAAWREGIGGVP